MYEATSSSSLPSRPALESDEISVFFHHLLQSSSSLISERPNLFSSSSQFKTVQEDHNCPCTSTLLRDTEYRVKDGTSTTPTTESSPSMDSSALILSSSGTYFPSMVRNTGTMPSIGAGDCDAVTVSVKRRNLPAGLDDFDSKSEEGLDAVEEPSNPAPSRTSKRIRAAEVHNLSEKRRRSRINEKMKALQNLIPNSNKTDKASMLDEVIEYLKQLQLQVQMLSMRNGLGLHPMYLSPVLEPQQLPQVRMGFSEGNELLPHTNMGTGTLPVNQELSTHTSFKLSNQCSNSHQPVVIPNIANITNPDTSYGLDSPTQVQQGPFQLSTTSEEIYREEILPQPQLHISHSRNPSGHRSVVLR